MGRVHRNGIPPKRFQYKVKLTYPDYEWSEDRLIKWGKEFCTGAIQYDTVLFQGPGIVSKKTIDLTVWFEKKKDAMLFKLTWVN